MDYVSKIYKSKGYVNASTIETKISTQKEGNVYLKSTCTHGGHGLWLIESGALFHMNPHREWFYEYEKYNGGDVFLGEDLTTKIMRRGKVKLLLKDGIIRTFLWVTHIPTLARSLIFVGNMGDVGVDTLLGKGNCKMV
jgi:hypothetical protein